MKTYIAIDIGGSKIFAMRADASGKIQKKIIIPTEASKGSRKVIANLCSAVNQVKSPTSKSVGIAWAGLVNSKKGIISKAPNIPGFINYPIKKELEKKLGLPVFIENDARLFALGEANFMAKKRYKNLLGIIIGTGIGSGMIIDGKMFTGHDGFAGEIGHAIFHKENGLEIEDTFCASALKNYLEQNGYSRVIEEARDKWLKKDKKARVVLNKYLDTFSMWISNLILAFNPEIIVLGGGVGTQIFPSFIPYITIQVKKLLRSRGFKHTVKIQSSTLENAGALGALTLAINETK